MGRRPVSLVRFDPRQLTRLLLVFCVVLIGYVVGAYFAFYLLDLSGLGAVLFLPAGVTASAMLLSERSRWPLVMAAAFTAEMYVNIQQGRFALVSLLGFALANSVEPLIGALVATRLRPTPLNLRRRNDLLAFLIGCVIVGPLVGGLIGGATVHLRGGPFRTVWFSWALGDSLGVLVVAGLVMTAATATRGELRHTEAGVTIMLATVFGIGVHWITDLPVGFLAVVPLALISARLGSFAAAITTAIVLAVAVTSWIPADGTVAGMDGATGILVVKLQLWAIAATGLLVAAESFERQAASALAGSRLHATEVLRSALAPDPVTTSEFVDAEGFSKSFDDDLKVGGDWYDVLPLPDGRTAIMIGDVAGHGEDALVTMGKLRFAGRALSMFARQPGEIADALDVFSRETMSNPYATAFFAIFDPERKTLSYSTAGHPPPMLGSDNGTWQWLHGGRSTPIGLPFPQPRPTAEVELTGPATLVIYTDGVVERAGEVIDSGLARMFDAVVRSPDSSVSDLVHEVTTSRRDDDTSFVRVRLRC